LKYKVVNVTTAIQICANYPLNNISITTRGKSQQKNSCNMIFLSLSVRGQRHSHVI